MGFTVEDRYLHLPTSAKLTVLHLAKKESHRSLQQIMHRINIHVSLTSVHRIIKYDLRPGFMSVHHRFPIPGGRLIVIVY